MKILGTYKYKWAIILQPQAMRELESLILRYYENPIYTAYLTNKNRVRFESLNELLEYDNTKGSEIKSLSVFGQLDFDSTAFHMIIRANRGVFVNYTSTVEIEYVVKSPDDELTLNSRLKSLFDKTKARYSAVGKISLSSVFMVALVAVLIYAFSVNLFSTAITLTLKSVLQVLGASALGSVINISGSLGLMYIFPSVVFNWGMQIEKSNRISALRTNIFWGVIISFVLSIIIYFITK